jgi:membrane protease YdiL (CAAX protease family)
MFIHVNYVEELYFRKSKKRVVAWAFVHIAMGIKVHMAILLLPIGFLFKYIYDKKGINHSYAMHFATNILVVIALFLSFII